MHQNPIHICISWYNKICWFPVKKRWCQQNLGGVSRDSYVFWIFFREGITVPGFIIVRYVWQILGRRAPFCPLPPIREQPRKCPSWIGLIGFYYLLKLLCYYLHLVAFYVSFKYQIKHQKSSTNQEGNKKSRIIN